jgi:hypothetical protein
MRSPLSHGIYALTDARWTSHDIPAVP